MWYFTNRISVLFNRVQTHSNTFFVECVRMHRRFRSQPFMCVCVFVVIIYMCVRLFRTKNYTCVWLYMCIEYERIHSQIGSPLSELKKWKQINVVCFIRFLYSFVIEINVSNYSSWFHSTVILAFDQYCVIFYEYIFSIL